ncbi:glycosyltransferase family 4 protein [Hanstruepera ponticola]|uniref:glycosyltransferase family 4 protein n=1 Tax=Hanstruepera ponticola TaxID=2042995 RepID=UPI000CF0EE70|nr:glycosyltransferase family 4 protein [Hanstruepera ponticola]
MRVGFIMNNHYPRLGGMEYAVHNLVLSLNNLNDVTASVACATLPEVPKDFEYPYNCYRSKSFWRFTPWLLKQNRLKMINEEKVNVLHGPMLHGGGFTAVKLGKTKGLPVIAHSRGADVQVVEEIDYGAQLYPDLMKKLKYTIKNSDKLIAVSQINKQNMVDLGADPNKIEVIHNGILIDKIKEINFINQRPSHNLSEEDFVLISVGRNSSVKRMDLLFQALQKLKAVKKIKCVCVGPETNLAELASKYDVTDKIVLPGRIPKSNADNLNPPYADLINWYRSSDLYITTSYVEAFSGAATDALACGLPIIIGQKHGVSDVIEKNKTGWIMTKETPGELADLIMHLYEEREYLKTIKTDIKKSVSQLTWTNIAVQTRAVYKSVV